MCRDDGWRRPPLKVVYWGFCTKSLVRVFCEENLRFACQSGPRPLAKMARPAMLPTVMGLAVAPKGLRSQRSYRRAAPQVAARSRGRCVGLVCSAMRKTTEFRASCSPWFQMGGEQPWEWPGRLDLGMRPGMGLLRTCVSCAGVMLCRGEACAGSCGVRMCFMSLCSSEGV